MTNSLIALLDGTLVDPAQPIVRGDDDGVVRGDGVFDALLVVDREPRDLDAHLERLAESSRILSLPLPDSAGYRRAVDAVVRAWDWEAEREAILRLFHTRGPAGGEPFGWVMGAPVPDKMHRQRENGVKVLLLDRGFEGSLIVDQPWLLPGAKSLSYAINMAAERHAAEQGADDVLFHSPTGAILEGPTSSLVVDLDGVLVTPPFEGVLRSITIEELLADGPGAGFDLDVRPLHLDDLARIRGAWLLSSGRRVARVTHFDGEPVGVSPLDVDLTALLGV